MSDIFLAIHMQVTRACITSYITCTCYLAAELYFNEIFKGDKSVSHWVEEGGSSGD